LAWAGAAALAACHFVAPHTAATASALAEPSEPDARPEPEPPLLDEAAVNRQLDRRLDVMRSDNEHRRERRAARAKRRRAAVDAIDEPIRREPVELSVQPLPPPSE